MISANKLKLENFLTKLEIATIRKNRIVRYFPEVHLGNGHEGLAAVAKKNGIEMNKLNPGEFLIFVNKTQTALKLYTGGNMIAHLKMPGSEKINPRVITMLPQFFNGSHIDYNGALKEAVSRWYK